MKTLLRVLAFLLTTAALTANPSAVPTALQPGTGVPAVTVNDIEGRPVDLQALIRSKPTVLVFYRGSWCPYCMRHLAALGEVQQQIVAAGFQLVAISADQPAVLKGTPNREKLGYVLLSDATMTAGRAFGITFQVPDELVTKYKRDYHVDLEGASGQTHHLLPHPSVFVIDRAGVIRFTHVNPDYKVRLTGAEILQALAVAR
jgi:peroxiredoxin